MKETNVAVAVPVEHRQDHYLESRNPKVSASSKFLDLIWSFVREVTNPTYTKYSKEIQWNFKIGKAARFSDPKFSILLRTCKQLLYAFLWNPEPNRRMKPDSVIHSWLYLRHFVKFLINRPHPILRFKDVTKFVVSEYLNSIGSINRRGKTRNPMSLLEYYNILRALYLYRHKVSDTLQFDPFDGEAPTKVLGITGSQMREAKTEIIPDNILIKLITCALDYVNFYSDYIIKAAELVERIRRECKGKHPSVISYHTNRRLKSLPLPAACEKASFRIEIVNRSTLAEHLMLLRTACFILIAFVTGMRISEILSLEAGCVETEETDDGKFIWVHSTLHKNLGGRKAVPTKWLCGPVAAKAISVLESLTRTVRRKREPRRLFVPVTKWGAHTFNGKAVGAAAMTNRLKDFVGWLDLKDEAGNLFNLHAHMFRRTFARHVVRSDTTNLLALQEHFKHVSIAMTDLYVGLDEELQDMLNDEVERLAFESFDKALRSDRLGGPRGKELAKQIDGAIADGRLPPEFRGEAGAHLRREMIIEWVEAGQQIYPGGAGNVCWFRRGSAQCTEGDRPVVEVCNPLGCANSIILPEHRPYWHSIEAQAEECLCLKPKAAPYRRRLETLVKISRKIREDIE